jgi:hypothetical protein
MKRLRGKLTYANVISTLCLVLFVGGGSAYAAARLESESVGTEQLKKGAVTPTKLSKGSKAALTGPAGPRGAAGPSGPQGERGQAGPPGPLVDTLPSGRTLTGMYAVAGVAGGKFDRALEGISFSIPLASAPASHVILLGGSPTPECPGSTANPQAAPGNLCLYEDRHENILAGSDCATGSGTSNGCGTATRFGAIVFVEAGGENSFFAEGSWAVTGP